MDLNNDLIKKQWIPEWIRWEEKREINVGGISVVQGIRLEYILDTDVRKGE